MKNKTNKQVIIIGFTTILGIALILVGFAFTDNFGKSDDEKKAETTKAKVTVIENVPTGKDNVEKNKQKTTTSSTTKKETVTEKQDTEVPVINAPEATVYQGSEVNVYDSVTATDNIDGDITSRLVAENSLDTSTVGSFTVQFSATDTSGNKGSTNRVFHVIDNKAQSEPQPAAETPVAEHVASAPAVAAPVTTTPTYAPMTLTMNGTVIPYQNGGQGAGQSIIDANPNGVASTWGGAAVQSGDDGQNTHFIGHNPGIFSAVFSLSLGSQIVVTDAAGTPTTYTVQSLIQLDDYGNEVGTGTNYFDFVTGSGGDERISLQSCINDDINLFAIAYK